MRWLVTASHNPPEDNGYKVYLGVGADGVPLGGRGGDGAQIVPPADVEIEAAIRAVGPLADVTLGPPGDVLGEEIVESYLDGAVAALRAAFSRLARAHSRNSLCCGSIISASAGLRLNIGASNTSIPASVGAALT